MARTSVVTIDTRKVDPAFLFNLESVLYGTAFMEARLPLPGEVIEILSGSLESLPLWEDANDRGTFIIVNDSLVEDPNNPGEFIIQDTRIQESELDEGTFVVRS